MKKIFTLSTAIILSHFSVFAAFENYHIGARSAGLANSTVSLVDFWSIHHNQAGLAYLTKMQVGTYYESRFSTSEISLKGGALVLPTKSGTFGIDISSLGNGLYSENKFGLAFARKLSKKISMGVQLDYMLLSLGQNYGSKGILTGEIGFMAKITKALTIGAHVFNPMRTKISDYNVENAPTILRLGAKYSFSDKVFTTLEAEKDIDYKLVIKAGLEYHITKPVYLRIGISTNPYLSSFGVGYNLNNFSFNLAASYHTVLGYTPQLSLSYKIK